MRRSTWLVGMGVALAMLAAQATFADSSQPQNSQQQKMTTCNSIASSKNLTGDARKSFMQQCLSKDSTQSAKGNSQQQKMKSCNADPNSKGLKGDARQSFMSTCLSGSHSG